MKNYSPDIAAYKLVGKRLALGKSRHLVKAKNEHLICGASTALAHTRSLQYLGNWMHSTTGKHLKNLSDEDAFSYLTLRALTVGQSAVDLDRQAINFHLLYENPIPFIASTIERKLTNRAYTSAQLQLLVADANEKMRLSIEICIDTGMRAVELITIAPLESLTESERNNWHSARFLGREDDVAFVVSGKGGLRRQVRLSRDRAQQLLLHKRPSPITVFDRKVSHRSYFDLIAGANFSMQFSNLSREVLGMSSGAHGIRHSFAQKRLRDLICLGLSFETALLVLSNELGHFATTNTFAYLRD